GGEEHLGRGRMRVFLEEMVLDFPHVVDAHAVRELHLFERVLIQLELRTLAPGLRVLVLVEDAELHARSLGFSAIVAHGAPESSSGRVDRRGMPCQPRGNVEAGETSWQKSPSSPEATAASARPPAVVWRGRVSLPSAWTSVPPAPATGPTISATSPSLRGCARPSPRSSASMG